MASYSIEETMEILAQRAGNGQPIPCRIQYVSCDLTRNTGGERHVVDVVMFTSDAYHQVKEANQQSKKSGEGRTSENWRNMIRNLQEAKTLKPLAVHPILIEKINGVPVAL